MATRIISDPVRSGQQIYVADGDLVVSTTVSPGAEVVADGCVHIYGALRGRAIAGARGETSARIFCRRFEAELRSEEHTSELQSLMRISYAVFCSKKKTSPRVRPQL